MGSNGSTHPGGTAPRSDAQLLPSVSQRDRLLRAMAETVSHRGYATTSVADVLKVARISRRTFYEQFIDKEDCFLAAYDAIAALCAARVTAAFRAEPHWEDGLTQSYTTLLCVPAAEPAFARLAIVEVLAAGPRALNRRDEALRRFAHFIAELRVQTDVPTPPGEVLAQAIGGGIYELIYSRLVREEPDELPGLVDELVHFTLMLLGFERRPA